MLFLFFFVKTTAFAVAAVSAFLANGDATDFHVVAVVLVHAVVSFSAAATAAFVVTVVSASPAIAVYTVPVVIAHGVLAFSFS